MPERFNGKTTTGPDIDPPQSLILCREPKANVERHDRLRAKIAGAVMRHAWSRRWCHRHHGSR